jgi:hypothetical protein
VQRWPTRWIAAVGAAAILTSCASMREAAGGHAPPQRVGGLAVTDVNGDGIVDLIAGLPGSGEYGRETPGRVVVWFGGKRGLRARADATFVEPALGDGNHPGSFGQAVAAVGDVNRDGFADILVGAPSAGSCTASRNARLPPLDGGRVFLLAGARAGFAAAPAAFVDGARMGGRFGSAFRGIGDLDGDGDPEVIVDAEGGGTQICYEREPGVRAVLPPQVRPEEVILRFRASGFSPWPNAVAKPDDACHVLIADFNRDGRPDLLSCVDLPGTIAPMGALATGDVNGDGIPDLAAGHSDLPRGRLYFYPGAAGRGLREPPAATLIGPLRDAPGVAVTPRNEAALSQTSFGFAVVVTDVDRDGFADIVVGAPWDDKIHVYAGSPAGPRQPARQTLAHQPHTWFPDQMVAGDFDGDGYGDIAVTDQGSEIEKPPRGPTLTVYRGSAAGLVTKPALAVAIADAVN